MAFSSVTGMQGNNGRLVITPLTDRCYMTLGAALFTRRGGNPLGPAGTGKTETVKDFGKALARYVIVFNCSDGVDYKMTGKMLSGLAQTGAWACLDEFNRIEVEVLSVVATQISALMQAIKEQRKRFNFLGQDIRLIPTCGVFVTMNPGYAGRSELPDNLKAIVRPVSMMVPDFTLIAEIMMFSEGFSLAKVLAKKMIAIMELSQQQLSKQDHYDYGLRSFVIPIARAAGALKRNDPEASEEVIMYRTMLDLIKPKLVYLDLPLFMALLSDLFPGVELPSSEGGELRAALEQELLAQGLQVVPEFLSKIIQV
jgi:dynein heavy chain